MNYCLHRIVLMIKKKKKNAHTHIQKLGIVEKMLLCFRCNIVVFGVFFSRGCCICRPKLSISGKRLWSEKEDNKSFLQP